MCNEHNHRRHYVQRRNQNNLTFEITLLFCRSYAERLGCERNDTSEEIVTKLRTLPVTQLQVYFTSHSTKGILYQSLNYRYTLPVTQLQVYSTSHSTTGILYQSLNYRYTLPVTLLQVYSTSHSTTGILYQSLNYRYTLPVTQLQVYNTVQR